MVHHGISDLVRQAEQNLRNDERLAEWRRRYRAAFGRYPKMPPKRPEVA